MFNSQSPLAPMFQHSTSSIGMNSQPADPNVSVLSRSAVGNDLVLPTTTSPLLSLYNPAAQTGLVQELNNNHNNSSQPTCHNTVHQNTTKYPLRSQPTAGAKSSPNLAAPLDNSLNHLSQLWSGVSQPATTTHAPHVQSILTTYGQTAQDASFQVVQSLREDKGSAPQYLPSFLLGGAAAHPTSSPANLVTRDVSFFGTSPYGDNATSRRLVENSPGTSQGFRSPSESTQGLLQGRNPYGPPALQRRLSAGSGFGHNDMLTSRRKKELIPMDMVTVIDDIPPAATLDDLATHTTIQGSGQSAVAANDLPANSAIPPPTSSSAISNSTMPVPDTVYSTVPVQSLEQHGYKVTVFGFPPAAAQAVLHYFQTFGQVITCTMPTDNANYVTLVYAQPVEAHRALLCNGQIIGDNVMVGVKTGNQRTLEWMEKHKGLGGLRKNMEESAQKISPSKLARGAGDFFRALTGGLSAHSQQQQSVGSLGNNSMLSSMVQESGGNLVNGQTGTMPTTSPTLDTSTQFRMSPFNNNTQQQLPGENANLPGRSLQQQALLASHYQATAGSRPGDTSFLSTSQLGPVAQPSHSNTTLLRQPTEGIATNGRTSSSPFGQLFGESQQDQLPRSSQPLDSGFSPLFPSATNRSTSTTAAAISLHQTHNASGGARSTRVESFDPVPSYQLSFARNSQYNPPVDTHTHRSSLNGSFGSVSSGVVEETSAKRRNSSLGPRAAPLPPALRKPAGAKEMHIKPIKLQPLADKSDEGSTGQTGNNSRNGLWQSAVDAIFGW
ncbi:hypothetical protein IWQ61_007854 [Dispira simplex]|nr:hypothetical protein IWQ61_007854 [Dispira simplex]